MDDADAVIPDERRHEGDLLGGVCLQKRAVDRENPGFVPEGANLRQERSGKLQATDQHREPLRIAAQALDELALGAADPEAIQEVEDRNVHDDPQAVHSVQGRGGP